MTADLHQLCLLIYFSAGEEETKKTHQITTLQRRWDPSRSHLSCTAQTPMGDNYSVSIRLWATPQTNCDCPEFYFRHSKRMKESRAMGIPVHHLSCSHIKSLAFHYLRSQHQQS